MSRTTSIGELAALGALQFGDGYRTKRSEHGQPGYRIIRVADVVDNAVSFEGPDFVSADYIRAIGTKLGHPGDILLTTKGTVGRVAVLPEIDEQVVYSPQLCYFRVVDSEVVNPRFLRYWFSSREFWDQAADRMNNTDMAAYINLADIRSLKMTLPSIPSQQAIAEVLGALDDKIAANTKLTASAAELAMTQFLKAYENAVQALPLSELVSTQYGVTTSAHGEPGPKFLRVTDINKKPWIEWETTPNCTISDAELSKYRVSAGDILVARMADPGKAAFINSGDPEAVFASYLVRLQPRNPAQALYIYYFLRSPRYQEYADGAMSGSVQKNMNAKVIVATDIDLPELDQILLFNEAVTPLRRLIQSHLDENRKLAATRDALLPQLMSGKLRVKDAEALVAAAV